MLKRLVSITRQILDKFETPEDTKVEVERGESLQGLLKAGERVLWQGRPSPSHAWADHDQMEPAGATPRLPITLKGRVGTLAMTALGILFLAAVGAGVLYGGIHELTNVRDAGGVLGIVILILLGLSMLSGLPFLARPWVNPMRARRLRYLITNARSMVVRDGHAWSEIWTKSPLVFSVSLLFLSGVAGFGFMFLESSYQDFLVGAGLGTWSARLFILVLGTPLAIVLATIGAVGVRFQYEIVRDALRDRDAVFVRSFPHEDTRRMEMPMVARIRTDGTGDVLLNVDDHWEFDIELTVDPWSLQSNSVGFLSVPNAKGVAERVREAMERP